MSKHTHEFTALWGHFGPYGRQDVHVHYCHDGRCATVVIGVERDCAVSQGQEHWREKWNSRKGEWQQETQAQENK